MDEQGYRFGVGVLVVASLVIAVILVLFFGAAPNFLAQRYLVTIRFESAPGVTEDTPVRKNGVKIGRVKDVQLLSGSEGVDLLLELDSNYELRARELPTIKSGSLITGDAIIEFVKGSPQSLVDRFDGTGGSPQDNTIDDNELALANSVIQDGDFLKGGQVAPDPLAALTNMQDMMGETMQAIESAGSQVSLLAQDLRSVVGGSNGDIQRIAQATEETILNFNKTLVAIEGLFADPNLKSAIATMATNLPELVADVDRVILQTGDTLQAFEDVGIAAEQTVQNINEFTKPFGEQGDVIVSDVVKTIQNLNRLLVEFQTIVGPIRQVATRINNGQGSIAKLIDDEELYNSAVRTLREVEFIVRRARPVIEDARVLTDKLSRDPSSILRNAIRRPSGGLK